LLWQADIAVSTAIHDFFGAAMVEAVTCDCFPVMPRRLAYPELIPQEWHDRVFYSDRTGLVSLLRERIQHPQQTRGWSLRPAMAWLDWSNMAPQYDQVLSDLVTGGGHRGRAARC
jgi:hypothetical protein